MNPLLIPFVGPLMDIVKQLLSGLGLDPAAKERAQNQAFELLTQGAFAEKAAQALAMGQIDVNKAEAGNASMFVVGWRPFIGWVCGSALAFQYILRPLWGSVALATGHGLPNLPGLDDNLWQLMAGMLGMGTLRTYEKVKGAA